MYLYNMELLGKCSRGNKIAPLWHEGRAERGPSAKGVQFYCPSSTYPAIVLLVLYSIAIFLQCDPVCKKIAPLQCLDAKKLHAISLHFHKNCILKRFFWLILKTYSPLCLENISKYFLVKLQYYSQRHTITLKV